MKKITFALVFILISSKICFATVLFQDDFHSDSLDNWSVSTGAWQVDNGALYGIGGGGNIDAYIYSGDVGWTNYDFEAKANLIEDQVMFVFRSTGHLTNEYRLQLWSADSDTIYKNTFQLTKYQNGATYDLSNGHISSPETITDTLIGKISVVDNNINIFVNDKKIFEYQDSNPLPNGKIALGVIWSKQASFDDVLVSNAVVPEPATLLLFSMGLVGTFFRRRIC